MLCSIIFLYKLLHNFLYNSYTTIKAETLDPSPHFFEIFTAHFSLHQPWSSAGLCRTCFGSIIIQQKTEPNASFARSRLTCPRSRSRLPLLTVTGLSNCPKVLFYTDRSQITTFTSRQLRNLHCKKVAWLKWKDICL